MGRGIAGIAAEIGINGKIAAMTKKGVAEISATP
jgi:hypothetical protein